MIYSHTLNNLTVKTGDLICTTSGSSEILPGQFWRFLGRLVPGEIDHIALYLGPSGRCIEAGAGGVLTFTVPGDTWDSIHMVEQRAGYVDELVGVVDLLAGRGYSAQQEAAIRQSVAAYCLAQAAAHKPYNMNFFNPETEEAFYCSQLAYKAYQPHGIDLNTEKGVPNLPGSQKIVFPQEIWSGFKPERAARSNH